MKKSTDDLDKIIKEAHRYDLIRRAIDSEEIQDMILDAMPDPDTITASQRGLTS